MRTLTRISRWSCGLWPHISWDCGFEYLLQHRCLPLANTLFCEVDASVKVDPLSRGVLPSVVCLSVISKLQQWDELGNFWDVVPQNKNVWYTFACFLQPSYYSELPADGHIWWSKCVAIQSMRNKKEVSYRQYLYLLRVVFIIKFLQKLHAKTRASSAVSHVPIKAETPFYGDEMVKKEAIFESPPPTQRKAVNNTSHQAAVKENYANGVKT